VAWLKRAHDWEVKNLAKIIYLIRHGENRANITREFSCKNIDYPLTERGRRQAQATAIHLCDKNICSIFSSPLKRAMETGQIIGKKLNLSVTPIENFSEINVGDLEGHPTEDNWKLHDRILEDWRAGRHNSRFPEGEDYLEVLDRIQIGFAKVLRASGTCDNLAIITHGGILLATISDICEDAKIRDLRSLRNCSITTLEAAERSQNAIAGKLISWHYCEHLNGLS
jgi:broad specificity phosphatase PhoE